MASDAGNVARYLAGEPAPSMLVKGPWLERLSRDRAAGIRRYRVHLLRSPLSDYLRYECEWGYRYTSAAGEEVYILDTAEFTEPVDLPAEDFWIFDDEHVVVMDYDDGGRFVGGDLRPPDEIPVYHDRRDFALSLAVPFEQYWAEHPQYWRHI